MRANRFRVLLPRLIAIGFRQSVPAEDNDTTSALTAIKFDLGLTKCARIIAFRHQPNRTAHSFFLFCSKNIAAQPSKNKLCVNSMQIRKLKL